MATTVASVKAQLREGRVRTIDSDLFFVPTNVLNTILTQDVIQDLLRLSGVGDETQAPEFERSILAREIWNRRAR